MTYQHCHNVNIRIKVGRVGVIGLVQDIFLYTIESTDHSKKHEHLFILLILKVKMNGVPIVDQEINRMISLQGQMEYIKTKAGRTWVIG